MAKTRKQTPSQQNITVRDRRALNKKAEALRKRIARKEFSDRKADLKWKVARLTVAVKAIATHLGLSGIVADL